MLKNIQELDKHLKNRVHGGLITYIISQTIPAFRINFEIYRNLCLITLEVQCYLTKFFDEAAVRFSACRNMFLTLSEVFHVIIMKIVSSNFSKSVLNICCDA